MNNILSFVWLGLVILFLIVEAACPIHLVSLWFAAGSLVSLITAMLGGPLWLQILLFAAVSAGLLVLLWPLTRKYLNPAVTATNVDAIIGAACIVVSPIDNLSAAGQVKLNGMEWTARSTSGEKISAGTKVRVDRIEGVKVFVTPAEAPAEVK